MSRFQPTYSDEQRLAVLKAIDGGMSHRKTAAAARAGELGLPAFNVAASTVSGWDQERKQADLERETRRAKPETVQATVEAIIGDQLYVLRRASKRNREAARRGKPDVEEASRIARAAKDIAQASRAAAADRSNGKANGSGEAKPETAKRQAPTLLDRLAAGERRAAKPEPTNA